MNLSTEEDRNRKIDRKIGKIHRVKKATFPKELK